MDKKNSQVFSAVAVPMSVAVVVVVVMVVAAGIMCFVANGGEGAADGLLPTPALTGTDREHAGLAGSDTLFRFESRVADLGRIRVGHKKKVVFRFTNVSSCPVVITRVMTTCECTSAVWDKAPLLPGRRSRIEVTYEAERDGVFFRKLFIYHAGAASPLEIAIEGWARNSFDRSGMYCGVRGRSVRNRCFVPCPISGSAFAWVWRTVILKTKKAP